MPKLRVFGNLTNRLQEGDQSKVTPVVGMGATILMHSDRYAATVVEILGPKRIVIQRDTTLRTDKNGLSENQTYTYVPNPNGEKNEVSLRKDGRWMMAKDKLKNGTVVRLGVRDEYCDPCF